MNTPEIKAAEKQIANAFPEEWGLHVQGTACDLIGALHECRQKLAESQAREEDLCRQLDDKDALGDRLQNTEARLACCQDTLQAASEQLAAAESRADAFMDLYVRCRDELFSSSPGDEPDEYATQEDWDVYVREFDKQTNDAITAAMEGRGNE